MMTLDFYSSLLTICQTIGMVDKDMMEQVLPPRQRRSLQAVQHPEDPGSHTTTGPGQAEIVGNLFTRH